MKYGMTQKGITVRKHSIRKPSMVYCERFEEMRASFMIEGCRDRTKMRHRVHESD